MRIQLGASVLVSSFVQTPSSRAVVGPQDYNLVVLRRAQCNVSSVTGAVDIMWLPLHGDHLANGYIYKEPYASGATKQIYKVYVYLNNM